ncbi:hypothetical protein U8P73_36385 (plasmid) [Rhizobium beringeri]|uniref:Acb2/Tad1 domain-containing protein n=1 Tax=Rhizobium beringeri TaxID=3019934 RepID=UPI002DDD16ED|nr:hypothetical protein [Rhizobium beringeri]WSG93451.1 hypothetical protein U8P73_36385 [Rhizobium beringeri]
MSSPYKNAVCRGSIFLKTGCGHCERCKEEQARIAEKSDTHQAEKLDSHVATLSIEKLPAGSILTGSVLVIPGGKINTDTITISGIKGLPVKGYAPNVEPWRIAMLNENKILEEKVLRRVDEHVRNRDSTEIDQASVQLARRHVEDAFYRLNRAIMQPKRIEGDLE